MGAGFRDTAHASAVGKSLLAQLDFSGRMNHLARYPSVALTERTITSRRGPDRDARRPRPALGPVRPPGVLRVRAVRGLRPRTARPSLQHRAVPAGR
ncbi:IclR family transcriptional regulator C-terminal domain-containing protein [Streptomyces sp. NPDC127114]|uniref:IclR family transcriptional regulator domain-containing protein n=1 Tax=Streptomyces sp. NPDC127114 TaxID=3345366 RepID=UPI00363D2EA7